MHYFIVAQLIRYAEALAITHLDLEEQFNAVKLIYTDFKEKRGLASFETQLRTRNYEISGDGREIFDAL
jgi:hypothetical protein